MNNEGFDLKTGLYLINRLNELMVVCEELEVQKMKIEEEYNKIVYELWERYPSLEKDINIQPKGKRKVKRERKNNNRTM